MALHTAVRLLLLMVLAGACVRGAAAGNPGPAGNPGKASEEAERIYMLRCLPCHGPKGRGDGPTARTLAPRPRDFQDHEWQESVTDTHIEKIIVGGGIAVGKSAGMPPNPDLRTRPEVVTALRRKVRGFGKAEKEKEKEKERD